MNRRASGTNRKAPRGAAATHRSGRIAEADLAEHEAMLLDAARALFYEFGFDGTSIDAVARIAHVSPKTIYGRFGGKDGLFLEAMRARGDVIMAPLQASVTGEADVRTALVTFAINLLSTTTQPEALIIQRSIIAQAPKFPALAASFHETGPGRGMALLAALFARAGAAHVLDMDDPKIAAEMFVGALIGVPIREALFLAKRPTRAAIVKRAGEVVNVFLRAYAVRKSGK